MMTFWHYVTIILLVSKLLGYFPHSWYWVFAPILALFIIAFLSFVAGAIDEARKLR
jgi:hypothetical protein